MGVNVTNSFLSPDDKNDFADWLKSLKREDLIRENFNGYEYEKVFKTVGELYNEWYNNVRDDNKNRSLYYAYSNGF
jgi:antibiotic biosynthesis monooxygenase (ABM) superfamily enzyme